MRRLIVVYNPRSSQAAKVEKEVLTPARQLKGWTVGKYAVRATNVNDNAERLAGILRAGDLVVVAGGDATATIGVNGVMRSGVGANGVAQSGMGVKEATQSGTGVKEATQSGTGVTLAVLGYGNFNDHARTWRSGRDLAEIVKKFEKGSARKLYPMEVLMDGKHWRWVACYFTVGMFAESTGIFEKPQIRQRLQKRKLRLAFSVWELASWYFKHKRKKFIPDCEVSYALRQNANSKKVVKAGAISDMMAVNSRTVARVMRGGNYFMKPAGFLFVQKKLTSFWRLVGFMIRSVFGRISGEEVDKLKIEFEKSEEVVVQAEGESAKVRVREIKVVKSKKHLSVI